MKKHKKEIKKPSKIKSTTIKPFLLMDGDNIIHKNTRSACMTRLLKTDGEDLKVVKNPRYKWIEIGDE